jgi:DNA-binding NtrC family response regulator
VERAVLLADAPTLSALDLFPGRPVGGGPPEAPQGLPDDVHAEARGAPVEAEPRSLAEAREAAEREHIRRVLTRCGGRIGDAAVALGVSRTTLWNRLRKLGLPAR